MTEKLKKDLQLLSQKGIVYHSVTMAPKKDISGNYVYKTDYPDSIVKLCKQYPTYKNVTLTKNHNDKLNGSLVFTGESYNLIGIDIDNKENTIEKYEQLSKEKGFYRSTLTVKTANDGFHEYYKLSNMQKGMLKNFNASEGSFFNLHVDIKYNNQLLFGPAIFGDDNEFTYEIIHDVDLIELPEYLFSEILRKMPVEKREGKKVVNRGKIIKKEEKTLPIEPAIIIPKHNIKDIQKAKDLILLLNDNRANVRQQWLELGYCLHNIDDSLLGNWIEFSKKSPKFEVGECEKLWMNMNSNGLTIGSLIYWVQTDNPKNYFSYKYESILKYIKLSYSMTNDDIARLFYKLKKYDLKCAQEEPKNIWYLLNDGIWEKLEGTSKIRSMINKDLIYLYRDHLCHLSKKNIADEISEDEKTKNSADIVILGKLIAKLKNFGFVTEIIKQSIQYFKEDKFIEKLDTDPYILCFGKDLFDLKTCEWRDTLPSDYCSLKCGVTKANINDKHESLLHSIFLDIFGTEERKSYMINCFSSFLNGSNEKQLFHVWMGKGANGKSVIQGYFKAAFGDYFCDMPTSLITEKEGSSAQANPELCRGRGKRVAFFSEPQEGSKLNNSIIRKWSGGERISCRGLYESSYQYDVLFKAIILCNTKFQMQDVSDDSIPRRCNYVDFKTKFDYNPRTSFQRLRNDKYGTIEHWNEMKGSFMNMLINNYIKLKANNLKFDMPKCMIEDKDGFVDSQNEVKEFLKSECTKTDNETDYVTSKNLFGEFINYARKNNIKIIIKEPEFKERAKCELPFRERYQPRENGKKLNLSSVFTNVKFNENEEDNIPFNNLDA